MSSGHLSVRGPRRGRRFSQSPHPYKVSSVTRHRHTHLHSPLDHPKVELILVPVKRLLPQSLNPIALRVVVLCSKHIVLVLFEEAKLLAVGKLRALFMVAAMDEVAKSHCGQESGWRGVMLGGERRRSCQRTDGRPPTGRDQISSGGFRARGRTGSKGAAGRGAQAHLRENEDAHWKLASFGMGRERTSSSLHHVSLNSFSLFHRIYPSASRAYVHFCCTTAFNSPASLIVCASSSTGLGGKLVCRA